MTSFPMTEEQRLPLVHDTLRRAMDSLFTLTQKRVLHLHVHENKSLEEVAMTMGMTVELVKDLVGGMLRTLPNAAHTTLDVVLDYVRANGVNLEAVDLTSRS